MKKLIGCSTFGNTLPLSELKFSLDHHFSFLLSCLFFSIPMQQIVSLPNVREIFPTSRAVLEALNTEIDVDFCQRKVDGFVARLP